VDEKRPTNWPPSLEVWNEHPGTKIDTALRVVEHHLAHNNATPLETDEAGNLHPQADAPPVRAPEVDARPDKIVIYSAFTSHVDILTNVSLSQYT
jgi:hypothetical protein